MPSGDKKATTKSTKAASAITAEEKAAMRELVKERKKGDADGENDVLAKIAEMQPSDRALAERLHALIKASDPDVKPKTWYGMPAYAKNGQLICFFQAAEKFKARYATLGFTDKANIDDGVMWPTSYALTELTPAVEAKIAALVKQAVS